MAGRGTPATRSLSAAGVAFTVHEYEHSPSAESYGREAVELLGIDADRVFKTLIASIDSHLVVAVVPVSCTVDLKALAEAQSGKRAAMADPVAAERATGYVLGGISPIGQRTTLPTVIDESALLHATVFVSAGRRGLELELAPADLIAITSAAVADIAR
jgi:Cys-tRNA(Pro)/Cys-tRNA(Cys) deacylase